MSLTISTVLFVRPRKYSAIILVCFVAIASVLGCSGGGGGGGGSSDSGSETGVRVLHAAIDAAPVDVASSLTPDLVSEGSRFAVSNFYHELPGGAQTVSLVRARTPGRVVASAPVVVNSASKLSFFIYGDSQFGLDSRVLEDSFPSQFQGSLLRLVNGTTGASKINSVITSAAGAAVAVSTSYGDASKYVAVTPGVVTVSSSRAADGASVNSTSLVLEEGRAYTVLIAGQVGYFVKGVVYDDN